MFDRNVAKWLLGLLLLPAILWAEVEINLQLINPDAQVFPLGDLDFTQTGVNQDYFIVLIRNTGGDTPDPIRIQLCFRLTYNGSVIATGTSNPFDLPVGQDFTFTSRQLNDATAVIAGQMVGIDDYDVDVDAVEGLRDDILQTGRAPSGQYLFELGFVPEGGDCQSGFVFTDPTPDDNQLTITNPSTLELLFPGRSVSENNIEEISTIFPYFQWISDVSPTADRYNIFVYEKFPDDQTPQDVLSHPPILHIEGYEDNFFQYPTDPSPMLSSGQVVGPVRLLEFGKTYYWFVESIVPTGTGTETLESDLFRFKVADMSQTAADANQILAFLRQILGPEYEGLLEDLREQGFEPNGNMRYEGSQAEMTTLMELLNKVIQGKVRIKKVEVY